MDIANEAFNQALAHLEAYVKQQMRAAGTPGLALALTDRQGSLHLGSYGLADVASRAPVSGETLFEIGSISKSFTALALLQLKDEGRIDLQAPVTDYLPWFQVPSRYGAITLHHLLSHTAGIIMGTEFTGEARYEVWALRETEVASAPGARFRYSNTGYKALGLVLEEVLGQSYGEIIQARILDPLGMGATDAVITHETRRRLAVGHGPFYDDRPAHRDHGLAPSTWLETATGDGSIAATASDLATYVRLLLNRGQDPRNRLLSETAFELMTQRVIAAPEDDEDHEMYYGYGLFIREEEGHTVVGHGGGMVGYTASILADLDDGLGAVALVNGPGEPGKVTQYALEVLGATRQGHELPPLPAAPDPEVAEEAAEYTGSYQSPRATFSLAAEGDRLVLAYGGERMALEKRGKDLFYVPHRDFGRFLLRFGRAGEQVVEACHGADWYFNERYNGPLEFDSPPEWAAYAGHYRAHNPWHTNFRVVQRKGVLLLVEPWGAEEELVALGAGLFRVGKEEHSPERLRFETVLGGQALRANLSCCDYYRTFTP
jgi:CubicO group peptidase (beta-lactamase class C family)